MYLFMLGYMAGPKHIEGFIVIMLPWDIVPARVQPKKRKQRGEIEKLHDQTSSHPVVTMAGASITLIRSSFRRSGHEQKRINHLLRCTPCSDRNHSHRRPPPRRWCSLTVVARIQAITATTASGTAVSAASIFLSLTCLVFPHQTETKETTP
ncbi:unnamed protein product [Lupinus luteus]|uniref:Uncharacterized protein n=1 Tax=Lupinus luteus TaxID=3873 RepID=A0AAV1WBK4_LUPLU